METEILVNNIFLYELFMGVKKINGHSGVNFSFKDSLSTASVCYCFDSGKYEENRSKIKKI